MYEPRILLKGPFDPGGFDLDLGVAQWRAADDYEFLVRPIWEERVAAAAARAHRLWDGTHFRLLDLAELVSGARLHLGTIAFRHIVTIRQLWDEHVARGHGPYHHISTAALLRTADGHHVFGKRMVNGTVDLIGGAFQPDEMLGAGANFETNTLKEIREETGIGAAALGPMTGLGVVLSSTSNVLVIADVETSLTRAGALEAFAGRDDDEMAELVFVPRAEIGDYLRAMTDYRPLLADLL
ncbi:MAG TPA: hypothetical protein VGB91_06760 [Rhizomicrobium sp.]